MKPAKARKPKKPAAEVQAAPRSRSGWVAPKVPEKLGAVVDALYRLSAERREVQRRVDDMKKHEEMLKNNIINNLPKSEASGVAGLTARAALTSREVPTVKDWAALCRHVETTGSWELLTRSVSAEAARERWDNDEEIPGVERYVVVGVSVTKLGGRR